MKKNLILKYTLQQKKYFISALIALISSSSSVLLLGKSMEYLIDKGLKNQSIEHLIKTLLFFLTITIILSVSTFLRYFCVTLGGEKMIANIRQDIFNHIIGLSTEFFIKTKTSNILSRIMTDIEILQSIITNNISIVLRSIFIALGSLTMLIIINYRLSFIAITMACLTAFTINKFKKKIKQKAKNNQDKIADITSFIEESISNINILKIFTKEQDAKEKFLLYNQNIIKSSKDRIKTRAILMTFIALISSFTIGLILLIGGINIIKHNISSGQLTSFFFYIFTTAMSLTMISGSANDLSRASGATENLFQFFENKPTVTEKENAFNLTTFNNYIKIQNLQFSYPQRKENIIFNNLSLTIQKNEKIAVIGHSGAGKTTLISLLLRLYDPTSGEIIIDGHNIKNLTLKSLRKKFSIVSQEASIFSTSILENIKYSKPKATTEEIKEAIQIASLEEFINQLPEGLETKLGNKGLNLSGGQKQRISIARAVLCKPEILILDEAASALDVKNEKIIQKSINTIMQNHTCITITHRLYTAVNSDKIIILEKGEIHGIGKHEELLKNNILYQQYFNTKI